MTPLRVLLVGSPPDRARLRAKLGSAAVEIVAEFSTLAAARAADLDYDAITIAGDGPTAASPIDDVGRRGRSWPDDDEPQESLTPREVQVLELLAEGLPNKAIAARLNISDQTVKFHVSSLLSKFKVRSRMELLRESSRLSIRPLAPAVAAPAATEFRPFVAKKHNYHTPVNSGRILPLAHARMMA